MPLLLTEAHPSLEGLGFRVNPDRQSLGSWELLSNTAAKSKTQSPGAASQVLSLGMWWSPNHTQASAKQVL